jgi:glycosyltransferase involved in cell wall biosynthesis
MKNTFPLVSIVTPVFNGEKYLRECIESILAQSYSNWEYTIANNCSTDSTLQIAQRYARRDKRIRVFDFEEFVKVIESYNRAFRHISPMSKYCKVVSADDWIMPDCLEKMVEFGESHPTVGIICGYQRSGDVIRWRDLPPSISFLSGRAACRLALLEGARIFGAPTAFFYRSDLVRSTNAFFPNTRPHADTSVCYEYLQHWDYGLLHEVLSAERIHSGQISSKLDRVGAGNLAYIEVLLQYGPKYLEDTELSSRKEEVLSGHYRWLGGCLLKMEPREFWKFHSAGLRELGYEISCSRVVAGAIKEAIQEFRNPKGAIKKIARVIKSRIYGKQQ